IVDHSRLRFACVTDVRDPTTGLPGRRPGAGVPSDMPSLPGPGREAMPPQGQFSTEPGPQGADIGEYGQPGTGPVHPRQPQARLIAPGGRHRRPMPAHLPEGAPRAPAPNVGADGLTG